MHGTSRVAEVVLIGAAPPLMLKKQADPAGSPDADGIQQFSLRTERANMSSCTTYKMVEASIDAAPHPATLDGIRLLIVDSDPGPTIGYLREGFAPDTYRVQVVRTGAAAIERITKDPPNIILLDSHLPDASGLEIHLAIRQINPNIPVIFLTMDRTADAAIAAMKQGVYDLVFKPFEQSTLQRTLTSALQVAPTELRKLHSDTSAQQVNEESNISLCGTSPKMREVFKAIGLVAGQDVNVLITGESGTGKELVARAIYQHSTRSERPFLALNCAAIPDNLLESELFGHEKGAFSGADRRRIGKFEQCNGGTILLDEIGDMSLTLQAKILRLLQEQTFERVGGNETIRTNVRIIASTHRDLKRWSAQEKFRPDLYYRLSVFTIHLPPLRERISDLPMLVQHFLRRYGREMGRTTRGIDVEAMDRLEQYSWPGNIRELQSVLKQALLSATGEVLLPGFLPPLLETPPGDFAPHTPELQQRKQEFDIDEFLRNRLGPKAHDLYSELHRELDRHSLSRVLKYTRGNRQLASHLLGIARQTLRRKLTECGLQVTQSVETDEEDVETAIGAMF
jgi:DNA-binding NtrC family response regulator